MRIQFTNDEEHSEFMSAIFALCPQTFEVNGNSLIDRGLKFIWVL